MTFNRILGLAEETTTHGYGETTTWVHPDDRERVDADSRTR